MRWLALSLVVLGLGAGCQLLVDPDPSQLGDGAVAFPDASPPGPGRDGGTPPKIDGGPAPDAGTPPAGDASTPPADAGPSPVDAAPPPPAPDASLPDASLPDGNVPDGNVPDAGPASDAGVPDAGSGADAGEPCGVITCPPTAYCDILRGVPECYARPSCDTVRCSAGSVCQLVDVVCVRAPCLPVPECVPTCTKRCGSGKHCAFKADSSQTCVDDAGGTSCGSNTCSGGLTCCNASCGTCVPPGSACSQIACK